MFLLLTLNRYVLEFDFISLHLEFDLLQFSFVAPKPLFISQLSKKYAQISVTDLIMMNNFCSMIERRKEFILTSSGDYYCQRSSLTSNSFSLLIHYLTLGLICIRKTKNAFVPLGTVKTGTNKLP